LVRFEFKAGTFQLLYPYCYFVWRIVFACLVVCRCGMAGSNENRGKGRRPGAEDRGWSHRSGTQWPDDREAG
jgi:hypothetical protein